MSRWILKLSAGTGPLEARRFVALLAARLEGEARARGLDVEGPRSIEGAPRSITLGLTGDAPRLFASELGTHELLDERATRGKKARKRWFVGVSLVPSATTAPGLEPRAVVMTAARASGPGGQHVNKTASAVRARHVPTGLSVRVADERSQHANRRRALERLESLLEEADAMARAEDAAAQRLLHYRVVRGQAVRSWRLDRGGHLVPAEPRPPG